MSLTHNTSNNNTIIPPLWLIVLIGGITLLSETVYSPAIVDVAASLNTSIPMVENTLTVYLLAIGAGILFFGPLSDRTGRKPCLYAGLVIYFIGCISCYLSTTIWQLMFSRIIQAFGASVGSVIAQSICRDAYTGRGLGKAYSIIGSALSIFPAIGPIIGGFITEQFSWNVSFLFLGIFAIIVILLSFRFMPETHTKSSEEKISILKVSLHMLTNTKVVTCGLLVAICNAMVFSFFAEGSFIMIDLLHLSPKDFGSTFLIIATSGMLGGLLSKRLHNTMFTEQIIGYGVMILVTFAFFLFGAITLFHHNIINISHSQLAKLMIASQMGLMFGRSMVISNALALALTEYQKSIGTSVSLLGFFYYSIMGMLIFIVGAMHNGTIIILPLFLMIATLSALILYKKIIHKAYKSVAL